MLLTSLLVWNLGIYAAILMINCNIKSKDWKYVLSLKHFSSLDALVLYYMIACLLCFFNIVYIVSGWTQLFQDHQNKKATRAAVFSK